MNLPESPSQKLLIHLKKMTLKKRITRLIFWLDNTPPFNEDQKTFLVKFTQELKAIKLGNKFIGGSKETSTVIDDSVLAYRMLKEFRKPPFQKKKNNVYFPDIQNGFSKEEQIENIILATIKNNSI